MSSYSERVESSWRFFYLAYKFVINPPVNRVIRKFDRSTMWAPLIFLLLGQAYLLSADPVPKTEKPHNAFWWVENVVVKNDTSIDLLWLRQWLVNDPDEARAYMKTTLNNTQNALRVFKTWFASNTELMNSLIEETAVESWYVAQALDSNQDAETWESLKATRNDTEFAIIELRETLSNESALFTAAVNRMAEEQNDDKETSAAFFLLLMAAIGNADEDDSSPEDDESESLWKKLYIADSNKPRNAFRWLELIVLTDTSNETEWLREAMVKNPEAATEWIKQSLCNTRDTMAAIKSAVKNETYALDRIVNETQSGLWYIDQALDEHQDAETWNNLISQRNDMEKATSWIRSNLVNSTQEVLTWFKEVVTDESTDTRSFLSFLFTLAVTGEVDSLSSSVEEDDDAFWSRLLEAKTPKNNTII